ncbi:MAG TPA: DinB family protein [Actinophytocola sp.]|uniref:DinB family protein n=1 Tax=Actinophytocola sp. TaxID=1872138 RepID=UPI002E061B11|nr:DinB family protein [Actinophytocola sp.]
MTIERTEAPQEADERTTLLGFLDFQRDTLAWKCSGLDHDQLRTRAVPPSTLSLLGLVRHMSDVERGWFRRTLAGEDAPARYWSTDDPDSDFDNVDTADVDESFALWHAECDRARELVAATPSLDVTGTQRDGNKVSLRWILVHMIEEYARHNGHADLLRERLDGATGE